MEYYNNTLCVSGAVLIQRDGNPNGIISKSLWDKWVRGQARVVRRGGGGLSCLLEFNSLPQKYRDLIAATMPAAMETAKIKPFKDRILPDERALTFFSNYTLADGRHLTGATQREYAINASFLNALREVLEDAGDSGSRLGKNTTRMFWQNAIEKINSLRADFNHKLPSKATPLKRKFEKYMKEGYNSLVSGKYCNDNSRKVNEKVERLVMSLYAMPNKPFAASVHMLYLEFLAGKLQVIDAKTGEIFDRAEFIENGEPIIIGKTTVWKTLNEPANRPVVDKVRMGGHRYNNVHRPHHHRRSPEYSFSKISMDDRDLPRKCVNGKWVKAYYAYDVTSGCVIGWSHSEFKNEELFLDCLRNMFRLIEKHEFPMPMEVEVENHLVNKFFDDLAHMFPFVRICRPGNSQEKRAEHFNRAKKYGTEKAAVNNIGRWWSKHEAYTVDRDKKGDEFVDKVILPFDQLVADDEKHIHSYNNSLHPKQQKYPGKTRLQVLAENINPNAREIAKSLVYKYIGYKTATSINRNQYAHVQGAKYAIPSPNILKRLTPGNYSIDAYYLPDQDGMIDEVHMYHNGEFLCTAAKLIAYNESRAERTNADEAAFTKQAEFVAQYDKMAKDGKEKLAKAVIIKSEILNEALETEPEIYEAPVEEAFDADRIIEEAGNDNADEDAINSL